MTMSRRELRHRKGGLRASWLKLWGVDRIPAASELLAPRDDDASKLEWLGGTEPSLPPRERQRQQVMRFQDEFRRATVRIRDTTSLQYAQAMLCRIKKYNEILEADLEKHAPTDGRSYSGASAT